MGKGETVTTVSTITSERIIAGLETLKTAQLAEVYRVALTVCIAGEGNDVLAHPAAGSVYSLGVLCDGQDLEHCNRVAVAASELLVARGEEECGECTGFAGQHIVGQCNLA